jgi:hypothetical protein
LVIDKRDVVDIERKTDSLRVYAEMLDSVRDEQMRIRKETGVKLPFADLIEEAWREYKKEARPIPETARQSKEARRLHVMLDYLLEAGNPHVEAVKSNMELLMMAVVTTKDFPKNSIDRLIADELMGFEERRKP